MTPPQPDPNAVKPVKMLACIGVSNQIHLNRLYELHNTGIAESYADAADMKLIEVEIRPVASPSVEPSMNQPESLKNRSMRNKNEEIDQLKAEVEKLSHDNEFYIFSLNNIKNCGDGWSKSIARQTLEGVPNSWEGCRSPIGDKAWWTLAQEQNVENAVTKIHHEDTDLDLKNMWESVQRTQRENLDLKRSNDQLRQERSKLKDKIEKIILFGNYDEETGFLIQDLPVKPLYTPPSQEQSGCPDCGGGRDRPCECTSVKSKEVTAEKALEWLGNGMKSLTYHSVKGYEINNASTLEVMGEGITPLEAIRSAMHQEKGFK